MKRIDNPRVIEDADLYHDLQRKRRDLIIEGRGINEQLATLREKLLRAGQGHTFMFASADGFEKVVEFDEDEKKDVPEMENMLTKLRRKIPVTKFITCVVRYLTEDEEPV